MTKRLASGLLATMLAACSGAGPAFNQAQSPGSGAVLPSSRAARGITAPAGFTVARFAKGTSKQSNPDPIVVQGKYVYVAFQNATQPTGTGGNSTIVQYALNGKTVKSISVPGRCDGMRWDPYTNLMWITVNEDANSSMFTWDPSKGTTTTPYSFSSAKHGGGYDDLAFSGGQAFVAASNPKLTGSGLNKGPAVVGVTLNGGTAQVKPVLMGDATAKDLISGATVKLNLTDPDSMSVAPNGDVLLVSQGDSEIVWIHNAGKAKQSVSRLLVGTQLDDTVYVTKSGGALYVVDLKTNAIYTIRGRLGAVGTVYTEAPDDSGVAGFIGTVDLTTGTITPVITGFGSPTGLEFAR